MAGRKTPDHAAQEAVASAHCAYRLDRQYWRPPDLLAGGQQGALIAERQRHDFSVALLDDATADLRRPFFNIEVRADQATQLIQIRLNERRLRLKLLSMAGRRYRGQTLRSDL